MNGRPIVVPTAEVAISSCERPPGFSVALLSVLLPWQFTTVRQVKSTSFPSLPKPVRSHMTQFSAMKSFSWGRVFNTNMSGTPDGGCTFSCFSGSLLSAWNTQLMFGDQLEALRW